MTDCTTLAYLAGAIDSDGYISIKRSSYHRRVRLDAHNNLYQEVIGLKQVTREVPQLLLATFGGHCRLEKPWTANSRPLYSYVATDKHAAEACRLLLPYLRVKHDQAEAVLELRATKDMALWKSSYWFLRDHPYWQDEELITTQEAARLLGYKNSSSVSQAIRNGLLVALPYDFSGRGQPRIPRLLVEMVVRQFGKDGRARNQAPELVALRESLYQRVRDLNKNGVSGTPVYHRSGPYAPKK